MLIYFAILSVVTIGVYSLLDYVQRTSARVINTVQLTEQVDEAVTFIRTRLTNAEAILVDEIRPNDSACLTYETRDMNTLRGTWLGGEKTYVRDADFSAVSGNDNRTISAWIWAPTTQTGRNWILHIGKHGSDRQQYSLYLDDGLPVLDFKDANVRPVDATINLRDGIWHNIAIAMEADNASTSITDTRFRFFIDGTSIDVEPQGDAVDLAQPLNTNPGAGEGLIVGGRKSDGTESYHGALFDVRVWDTALPNADLRSIYDARHRLNTIAGADEVMRWRLDTVPSDNVTVPDESIIATNTGLFTQQDGTLDVSALPFSTTEERRVGRAFALYDLDGDNKHALWYNDDIALDSLSSPCPNTPGSGWVRMSEDILTTSGSGFFAPLKDNLRTPSLNVGFQSEAGRTGAAEREARQSRIGMNQRFRSEALCRHGHPVSFLTPSNCTDNITTAYAWIDDNYDSDSDTLVIVGATGVEDGSETLYNDVPFTDNITARWDPRTGVMTLRRTDNGTAPNAQWEQALRTIGYKPNTANYLTTKTLKFSLGRLSFEIDGVDHFYNFNNTQPNNWTDAGNLASAFGNQFCGIPGYLATITSARENAFLADRFINPDGTWPKGYLGGFDNNSDNNIHHWQWAAPSPEAGQRIWFGLGSNGSPIVENNSPAGALATDSQWESIRVDLDPDTSGDLKWHHVKTTAPVSLRYTNFSGGSPNIEDGKRICGTGGHDRCEPNNSGNSERWLQITGGVGHGLWNDMIFNQTCSSSIYAVCGFYEEWSDDNTSIRLVDEVELDLRKYREFCLAE